MAHSMVQSSQDSALMVTSESVNPMILRHLKASQGNIADLSHNNNTVFDSTVKSEKRYVSQPRNLVTFSSDHMEDEVNAVN